MASANTFPHGIQAVDIPDLASIHVSELNFGAVCFVISVGAAFTLTGTPSMPPDGINVVAPVPQAAVGKPGAAWEKGGGGGGTDFFEGVTLAQLATITGSDASTVIYVFDTSAMYRWVPGGVATSNGFTIVSAPGGQWDLQGSVMSLSPLGSAADDSPRFALALIAAAQTGTIVFMMGGLWTWATPCTVPSYVTIHASPDVVIHSTMANTGVGGFANSVFIATASGRGSQNALTADAVQGTNTVNVTSPIANHAVIALGRPAGGNQQQQATVVNVTNGGLTLTLDEEILYSYFTVASSAYVYTYTPPQAIRIYGNGARVYGTGDRVCEFAFGRDIYVDDLVCDQTLGNGVDGFLNILFSLDIATRDSAYSNCRGDGGGGYLSGITAHAAFALESNNRTQLVHCEGENVTVSGGQCLGVYDSRNCEVISCAMRNALIGCYVGANDANGPDGSRGITFLGFKTQNCSVVGTEGDKTSQFKIIGHSSIGDASSVTQLAAATMEIQDFYWQAKVAGTYDGWTSIFGQLMLSNGTIDMTSTSGTKAVCDWGSGATGTLRLDNVITVSGTFGLYLEDGVAQRVIRGYAVDLSSCGTPYRKGSTSLLNFGTVIANGTTPVPVAAACTAKDSPLFTQANGTPTTNIALSGAVGANTFSIVGLAGNTNTYNWWISAGGP